jgi:hypothetical protein
MLPDQKFNTVGVPSADRSNDLVETIDGIMKNKFVKFEIKEHQEK